MAAADPKDYKSPELQALLNEFEDVLVSSIPGGLPLQRVDADGRPIEHTIEVDTTAKPCARTPRWFTAEESAEILRVLKDFWLRDG